MVKYQLVCDKEDLDVRDVMTARDSVMIDYTNNRGAVTGERQSNWSATNTWLSHDRMSQGPTELCAR